ncbi:hypothetical protein CANARDRAFT_175704 [[Candida] arabinofermentans NRRL YB-2248]|uniref:Something about silencing protein 4 domain-containing protein n=1 Tax=[Candida] arabinofermentans NRRL YB-2248 TaxID=983967 RepID=A0A1E4T2I7_9ASCO|nr:hypothetical protein CANARDRAFT_175704 [[Candida] arabinofermentans NRRL YB-2248]
MSMVDSTIEDAIHEKPTKLRRLRSNPKDTINNNDGSRHTTTDSINGISSNGGINNGGCNYNHIVNRDLYDFEPHLQKSINELASIQILDTVDVSNMPEDLKLHSNPELLDHFKQKLETYSLNLIDVRDKVGDDDDGGDGGGDSGTSGRKRKRSKRIQIQPVVTTDSRLKNKGSKKLEDPLNSQHYTLFHNRGQKDEKKFSTSDKEKMLLEFENCIDYLAVLGQQIKRKSPISIKEQLKSYPIGLDLDDEMEIRALRRKLCNFTRLNNPQDLAELKIKYTLTLKELQNFVINFEKLRNKEMILKKQLTGDYVTVNPAFVKKFTINEQVDTDEDDDNDDIFDDIDFKKLVKKRMKKRALKYGPIIKVQFLDGVMVVIDPVSKPRVVNK